MEVCTMYRVILIILLILMLLAGCSDPVYDELISYYNDDLKAYVKMHDDFTNEAMKTAEIELSYLNGEAISNNEFNLLIESIEYSGIPKVEAMKEYITDVELETPEVKAIHNILLEHINLLYDTLPQYLNVLKSHGLYQNEQEYLEMREEVEIYLNYFHELQQLDEKFNNKLIELMAQYDINVKEE